MFCGLCTCSLSITMLMILTVKVLVWIYAKVILLQSTVLINREILLSTDSDFFIFFFFKSTRGLCSELELCSVGAWRKNWPNFLERRVAAARRFLGAPSNPLAAVCWCLAGPCVCAAEPDSISQQVSLRNTLKVKSSACSFSSPFSLTQLCAWALVGAGVAWEERSHRAW